jgi:membrane associated rhomboid family serine protease
MFQLNHQQTLFLPGVKNIIIINVLVFISCLVFQNARHIDLSQYLAVYSFNSSHFKIWQLITHQFMHGSIGSPHVDLGASFNHLFSNMLGLYFFGTMIEKYLGTRNFIIFYLLCGLGAALLHLGVMAYQQNILIHAIQNFNANPTWAAYNELLNKNTIVHINPNKTDFFKMLLNEWSNNPNDIGMRATAQQALHDYMSGNNNGVQGLLNTQTVGASGAVFGVLAAAALLFPNMMVAALFMPPMKLKYFVALYAAYEFVTSRVHIAGDNVAHLAHLGGLAVGLAIIYFYKKHQNKIFIKNKTFNG